MENNHPISELMSSTMQKIKEMVDVNTIVGEPIRTAEGITIIPVSKVSFGFASGGADFGKKPEGGKEGAFGGGSGAGVNITPISFLIVNGASVKLLPVTPPPGNTADRVIELVPEVIDKVAGLVEKKQEAKDNEGF